MTSRHVALAICAVAPVIHAGGVYWTDRGASELKRMNFDGSAVETIQLTGAVSFPGSNLRGIAVDTGRNRLFWNDNGADTVLRSGLDGSDSIAIVTITGGNSFPADVRIDPAGEFIYWCDQLRNRIQRSPPDGTEVVDVITDAAPTGPYFMELDGAAGKIYWGDFDTGFIYRANLDGSSRETLLTGNAKTRGVALDARGAMLYWINRDAKKVHRCSLSAFAGGTIPVTHPAVETVYQGLDTPHGLVLDLPARKLYWADTGGNSGTGTGDRAVCRGDLDGSTPLEVLVHGDEPWDVDLDRRCATYGEWRMRFFRKDATATQTDLNADPDVDGISNAAEYAHGLAPLHGDAGGLPQGLLLAGPTSGSFYPALRFRRQTEATDLTYFIQTSPDLKNWTGGPTPPHAVEVSATPLEEGIEEVIVRTLDPLAIDESVFLRMAISFSP